MLRSQILDVLESQARSALFPDAVITTILSQLNVTVTYTPLMCMKVRLNLMDPNVIMPMENVCIIIGNTVTAICNNMDR
ncbi:hypothetical protein KIN20_016349 [Parelaphostrongylus tenuis]|uniref:Uncharacterized protein n=1 Tax=Parelaphostrongylus tenuis TaxID=148309 RepID=A0AAD5QQP0_PARTN|nr:hypothetical protein KIN20_016349 [Parelaphostrongylus tenuis]